MADGVEGVEEESEADDGDGDWERDGADETTPHVELQLYQLSVKVSGQSDDELETVSQHAKDLMDYLVETAETLENEPDDRGLG